MAKVGNFLVESETAPPLWTFFIADEGDVAIFPNKDQTKVRALLKIQRAVPTYLYIGKNVDSNVLSRVESVNKTALEYVNITNKLDVSCLKKGYYLIKFSDGSNELIHKIIKHSC